MKITVAELSTLITANNTQFKGAIDEVRNDIKSLGATTTGISQDIGGNLFGSMVKANIAGTIITNTVGKLFQGTRDLTRAVIDNGSAYSRLKIATETVAANLGITREQLQGLRDDLADANTYGAAAENVIKSLALSGLVSLAEQLRTVDARSGEVKTGVTALTLSMKDLAAAAALDSDEGISRLTKFIQRGEATFADGLIELSNLNDEYRFFGASVGKTVQELSAQEKAMVRMNIVTREGEKVFGAYANTYESSGKIISSIGMLMKNITEILGSALEPILRVGGSAILQFFKGIQGAVFQSEGSIRDFANKVAGYMLAIARIVGTVLMRIPVIGKNFKGLANLTMKPIQAQGKLSDAVSSTGNSMDETAESAGKLEKELESLAGFDELNVLSDPKKNKGSGPDSAVNSNPILGGLEGGAAQIEDSSKEINAFADEATANFRKLGDAIDSFLKPLREFKVFGRPVLDILGDIAKWVGLANIAFFVGGKALGFFSGIIGTLLGLLEPFRAIIVGIAGALNVSLAPLLLVTAAVAALALGAVWLYQNFQPFRDLVDQIAVKIQEMAEIFISKLPEIQAAVQPLADAIGRFLTGAFRLLIDIGMWAWQKVLKPLGDFILANLVPAFTAALDVLIKVIKVFSEFAAVALDLLLPALNLVWEAFKQAFDNITKFISDAWNNVIKPVFQALWDFVTGLIIPVFQNLLNIARIVWGGILNAVRPVIEWFNANIMPSINKIGEGFAAVWNGVRTGVEGVWGGVQNTIKNGINGILRLVNGFIDKINEALQNFSNLATSIPGGTPINFRVGRIPYLATGGSVQSPTLAMIGENNKEEVVLPLDQNTQWASKVAALINTAKGDGGNQTIIVQLGGETIYEKMINYVNDKSLATNQPVFNI